MEAPGRRLHASVIERLAEAPQHFDFAQAVRLLETVARLRQAAPEARLAGDVGGDALPAEEAVRLSAAVSLRFPAAEVTACRQPESSSPEVPPPPPELTVAVMGLTGPSGVLPQHYTETLIASLRERNPSLRDFYDMFHHRLLSLFYRAMIKYRLPMIYERSGGSGDDAVTGGLLALLGLGESHLRDRQAVEDETLLYFSGLYSHRPRSASGLQAMLSEYFAKEVRVVQFTGHWLPIAADEQSRLAGQDQEGDSFCALGVNCVLGERAWDVQGSFRIQLGPMPYREFKEFMPGGRQMDQLIALVRFYVGGGLGFDVQLSLLADEVPAVRLGNDDYQPRLGWNTWMPRPRETRDRDDAIFAAGLLGSAA